VLSSNLNFLPHLVTVVANQIWPVQAVEPTASVEATIVRMMFGTHKVSQVNHCTILSEVFAVADPEEASGNDWFPRLQA
jgi:hypothetical protein